LTPERATALKITHGAEIATITPDSPAAKAGVKEKDVVVSFNGQTVADAKNLTDLIGQTTAGASVKLNIIRGNNQASVIQVQTTAQPADPATASAPNPGCASAVGKTLVYESIFTALACAVDFFFTGGAFCGVIVGTAVVSAPATAAAACASTPAQR
jgi:PDZ domain-containing secreted protein